MAGGGGGKAIIAAFIANLGIAIAKFVAFLVTGASSMLAEAGHSVADASNQGLLLLGRKRATRPADQAHPFGFGRERFFWAFVVAVVLFTAGAMFALFEGIDKLRHPHEITSVGWAVGVLVFGIALESWSLWTARTEALPYKGSKTWWRYVRSSKQAELPVVLMEDIGALLGLVFALAGIGLAEVTGNPRWDAVGTLSIGVLLGVIAIVLAIEMKSLLIGEAAEPEDVEAIRGAIASTAGIARLVYFRTEHIGPDDILVVGKVSFETELSVPEAATVIDRAEAAVRGAVPEARLIYLEPFAGEPPKS